MSLAVLNRMLRKILSLVLNCEKKRDGKTGETAERRTKEPITSMDNRSTQAKIPDPWFN